MPGEERGGELRGGTGGRVPVLVVGGQEMYLSWQGEGREGSKGRGRQGIRVPVLVGGGEIGYPIPYWGRCKSSNIYIYNMAMIPGKAKQYKSEVICLASQQK